MAVKSNERLPESALEAIRHRKHHHGYPIKFYGIGFPKLVLWRERVLIEGSDTNIESIIVPKKKELTRAICTIVIKYSTGVQNEPRYSSSLS
jgi:hypothetical protein